MAGWQCSHLVVKHPTKAGLECCKACYHDHEQVIQQWAIKVREQGGQYNAERLAAAEDALDKAFYRTAVWYARRKHIATCDKQLESDRIKAQALLDRNAESNKRAEQKRKGGASQPGTSTVKREQVTNSTQALNYYRDYYDDVVAAADYPQTSSSPMGHGINTRRQEDSQWPCDCSNCTNATSHDHNHDDDDDERILAFSSQSRSQQTAFLRNAEEEEDDQEMYELEDETDQVHHHHSSTSQLLQDSSNVNTHTRAHDQYYGDEEMQEDSKPSLPHPSFHNTYHDEQARLGVPRATHLTAPSVSTAAAASTRSRSRSRSPLHRSSTPASASTSTMSTTQRAAAQLLTLPRSEREHASTSVTGGSHSALSVLSDGGLDDDTASMRSLDDGASSINNHTAEDDDEEQDHSFDKDATPELGYPLKLPFWVSAHLVVRHPAAKDKETCLACLESANARIAELQAQGSENPRNSGHQEWMALDAQVKDSYWLTNGNGRFRHMADCTFQTQDTRDKARVRLNRYLAMARQRMKARHQREKEEKKRAKGQTPVPTADSLAVPVAGTSTSGAAMTAVNAKRIASVTPEPLARSKKQSQKRVLPVDEDLRALAIMPGGKKRELVKAARSNVMNTHPSPAYTDDEADLADLPPPMLEDSGSERSPSPPPERVKTPHSVSFRVTDEPFFFIRDSATYKLLEGIDENESFFAASASMYASAHDSSKMITAQSFFFDTPADQSHHTGHHGYGGRKRSPHLYTRRDEVKRRRVTPDITTKRAILAAPRTVKRLRHLA